MERGSLERLTTIWKANFNQLLDRMEDPEKMVRQFVRELEEEVDKAARAAASGLANQRRLEQQYAEAQKRIQALQDRAEGAVEAEDDEVARRVLRDKAAAVAAAEAIGLALSESREAAVQLRRQLDEFRGNLQEARSRQGALVGRLRAASKEAHSGGSGESTQTRLEERIAEHKNDFERVVKQVEIAEAEAEIQQQLAAEQRQQSPDPEARVEDELAALKKKIAGQD